MLSGLKKADSAPSIWFSGWRLVLLIWAIGTATLVIAGPRTLWAPLLAGFLVVFAMFVAALTLAAGGHFLEIFWPEERTGWWTTPIRVVLSVIGIGFALITLSFPITAIIGYLSIPP